MVDNESHIIVAANDYFLADQIMGLIEKKMFSQQGSTEYTKEQATYMHFKDFLDEMEGA